MVNSLSIEEKDKDLRDRLRRFTALGRDSDDVPWKELDTRYDSTNGFSRMIQGLMNRTRPGTQNYTTRTNETLEVP